MVYREKAKQRAYQKEHYEENKVLYIRRSKLWKRHARRRNHDHVVAYLHKHPCLDCGETDIRVLEFDHVRGTKVAPVSTMVGNGYAIVRIDKEIAKCEVRCANCHRRRTYDKDKRIYSGVGKFGIPRGP